MKLRLLILLLVSLSPCLPVCAQSTRPARIGALGVNLESCCYNYSRGLLYADAMLTAQPFASNGPGKADALGNPTADQTVLVIANAIPSEAGTYQIRAKGKVTFGNVASAGTMSPTTFDGTYSTATLTVTSQQLQQVNQIQLTLSNGDWAHGVINVEMWRPGATIGDLFYKPYLNLMQPFSTIRLMDCLATNSNEQVNWSDRATTSQRNFCIWLHQQPLGIPYEHCFEMARQTGKDIWINVPIGASDDFINQFAALVAQQAPIGVNYRVYVEYSNEVWNWSFPQWKTNQANAASDTSIKYDGMADPNILGWREYGRKTIKIGQALAKAYGVADLKSQIANLPVRVLLAGQAERPDVLKYPLDDISSQIGPPAQWIYGVAIAPYCNLSFPTAFNLTDQMTAQDVLNDLAANVGVANDANVTANWALADKYGQGGLHKLAYECGFDVGQNHSDPQTQACIASQTLPGIADAEHQFLSIYAQNGGELACWFTLTFAYNKFGVWGLTQDTYDSSPPKYQEAVRDALLMSWQDVPSQAAPAQPAAPPQNPAPSTSFSVKTTDGRTVTITIGN